MTALTAAAFLAVAIGAVAADGNRQIGVGLVLSEPLGGGRADPVERDAFQALLRARRNLHVRAKAVVSSLTEPSDLAPYDFLARRRYDLVIALATVPGISHAARRFPHVKFVSLDLTRHELRPPVPVNVEGTIFHTEQPAYLAGFVAARMADRGRPPHVVSSIGGYPQQQQVRALIAGFRAGAKRADPKIRLLNDYSYDYTDETICKHIALHQIARGSRVVFNVAGGCGLGALEAAKEKGVYGVGVDTDQSYLGRFILTSVIKNWKLPVYDAALKLVHGRLPTGGNLSFDLRNHGVYLGKFSRAVPRSLRRRVKSLAAQIEQRKIVVPATLSYPH